MLKLILILGGILLSCGLVVFFYWIFVMPGNSWLGPPPEPDTQTIALREQLERHVRVLATDIGERHAGRPEALDRAAEYIGQELSDGTNKISQQTYRINQASFRNLELEIKGTRFPDEIIVIGAHYDSVPGCPAANDNGSAVAALLVLAARQGNRAYPRTVRYVAFTNEELPYAGTPDMGSAVYVRRSVKRGERIVGMFSLETIGFYTDEPGSQRYPPPLSWFFPDTGNFVAFVGTLNYSGFLKQSLGLFRERARIPSEGVAAPQWIRDIRRSDHAPFWDADFPALMITDTAPFRYPAYHQPEDTPEKLDYHRVSLLVLGLEFVIARMAGNDEP